MMSPGMEQRKVDDRDCAVNCACGQELFRLNPGETILRTGAASRVVSATCSTCGRTITVRVGVANG